MRLEVISRSPEASPKPTPLLFVHGAWHGAWCWEEHFLPYFAANGYTAHALSLRNHGKSASVGSIRWRRLAEYVADVAEVVASLPTPPVLVGHSMGGLVVQKFLEGRTLPGAVLMAACPPGHGAWLATLRTARYAPLSFLRLNLTMNMYEAVKTPADAQHALFSAEMPAALVEKYQAQLGNESFLGFLGMLGLELPRPKRVTTPLLVLGGEKDTLFAPWEVRRTTRTYGAECIILPNMAHDMMLEQDWQVAADHILAWLGQHGL